MSLKKQISNERLEILKSAYKSGIDDYFDLLAELDIPKQTESYYATKQSLLVITSEDNKDLEARIDKLLG